MASTLDGNTLTVDNIDNMFTEGYKEVSGSYYHLPLIGRGKARFQFLEYSGYYTSIYTPDASGPWAVFVQSSSAERAHTKNSIYASDFLFLGIYNADDYIFTMPSDDFWIMYVRM